MLLFFSGWFSACCLVVCLACDFVVLNGISDLTCLFLMCLFG